MTFRRVAPGPLLPVQLPGNITERQGELGVAQYLFGWSGFGLVTFSNATSAPRYRGYRPAPAEGRPRGYGDVPHWSTLPAAWRVCEALRDGFGYTVEILMLADGYRVGLSRESDDFPAGRVESPQHPAFDRAVLAAAVAVIFTDRGAFGPEPPVIAWTDDPYLRPRP